MMRDARVATVVLNYRGTADTVECVRALQRSTSLDQRLIVVDNAAPGPEHDGLAKALAEVGAGHELVATGGNLGYAGGNNVGIERALAGRPEFVWLVNPDLQVEPGTLERLLATAGEVRDAAALGPRIVHGLAPGEPGPVRIWFDGGVLDARGATSHLHNGRVEAETPPGGPRDTDYVTGACLLLRADAVRAVGPVPEDYFLYFEETDYCRRLAGGGWRLVVDPRARAVHHKRSSGLLPTPAYVYYMRRNKVLFARRLGLDTAEVLAEFRRVWEDPWRANVARRAPGWLPTFDALVALAAADADADRTGPQDLSPYASAPESE